ncbi:MAG: hypothetical protein U1F56_10600 [Rubrivivax sp.]
MGIDPKLLVMGWNGHACDPRAPLGGGGAGQFRWPGATWDPFADSEDWFHPLGPSTWHQCCVLGSGSGDSAAAAHPTSVPFSDTAADFERWEGRVPHMYLDTKGLVTVGIGKMLPDAKAAQALAFVRRSDGAAASAAEIKTDYDNVHKQPKAQLASAYEKHTALILPDAEIDALLAAVVAGFEADLKANFAGYDNYPAPAKRALLDMIYNLGKSGLLAYKKLKKAVEAGKWKDAAAECYRHGPSQERNDWTRDRFLEAAN